MFRERNWRRLGGSQNGEALRVRAVGPSSHFFARGAQAGATTALLSACGGPMSALDPRGPAAARIAELWWVMFAVAAAVYLVVVTFLVLAMLRRRRREPAATTPDAIDAPERRRAMVLIIGGAGITALVLAVVFAFTLRTILELRPPTLSPAELTVRVTGRLWWWEITYPGHDVVTANELHIPTGRQVRLELTSADVIHSLWVPNLQGKTDLIPGKTNVMWIRADRPGVSRGQCAEYCGIQHTNMALLVVAEPPAAFERWLDAQRRPAAAPADPSTLAGQGVFLGRDCAYCHAVRGARTVGLLGPDLTHLASRRTIAAATLPNTRDNLARWITDPQAVKPGNKMPATRLDGEQLDALLAYLESLR